jgi:hypothetical protein
MSYSGYEEKVELGLTGPNAELPVCFPTALELLATHHTLKIATYLAYIGYCIADETIVKHKRNELATVAMSMMAQDVGLDSWKDIGFEKVSTERELTLLVRSLFKAGCAVIVDVDAQHTLPNENDEEIVVAYPQDAEPHAAGLVPISISEESFTVVSSWVPRTLEGVLTPEDLFGEMMHHADEPSRHRFNDANVSFFPIYQPSAPVRRSSAPDIAMQTNRKRHWNGRFYSDEEMAEFIARRNARYNRGQYTIPHDNIQESKSGTHSTGPK